MIFREELKGDFKRKWKHCLQHTMMKIKEKFEKEKASYKENYDARLQK